MKIATATLAITGVLTVATMAPAHAQRPVPDNDRRPCVSLSEYRTMRDIDRPWRRTAVDTFTETTGSALTLPDLVDPGEVVTVWEWETRPVCRAGMELTLGYDPATGKLAALVWGLVT